MYFDIGFGFFANKAFIIFSFILARIRKIKMSDDERDIDVESEDEYSNTGDNSGAIDKRAHHNASERKRRDHIKDSFTGKEFCSTLNLAYTSGLLSFCL